MEKIVIALILLFITTNSIFAEKIYDNIFTIIRLFKNSDSLKNINRYILLKKKIKI